MENERRLEIYLRQVTGPKYANGYARITPAQRRRIAKHDHRFWGEEERAAAEAWLAGPGAKPTPEDVERWRKASSEGRINRK